MTVGTLLRMTKQDRRAKLDDASGNYQIPDLGGYPFT